MSARIKNKGHTMKILKILLAVAIPFMIYGNDLPYDYIETTKPKITKKKSKRIIKRKIDLRKQQKEPNGFFIGIGGVLAKPSGNADGYSRDITVDTYYDCYNGIFGVNCNVTRLYAKYNPINVDGGISALLGYKWFFGEGTWGLRSYLDYNARFLDLLTSHNFTANLDILINLYKTQAFKFGIIVGMGYGLVYERVNKDYCNLFDNCDIVGESIKGNFGLRFVIYNNSAIEVLFQPQYSGKLFARRNSYNDGYSYSNTEDLLNGISETAIIGTLRFVYIF